MRPTAEPSTQFPTSVPTTVPTSMPITHPTSLPSNPPSTLPSSQPISQPSQAPSTQPTIQPSSQPTNRPSTEPPELKNIPFFESWQAKAASATPGTSGALFVASWIVICAIFLVFTYRRVKYEFKLADERRKQREAEEAYATLDEELTGVIRNEKYEYWRNEPVADTSYASWIQLNAVDKVKSQTKESPAENVIKLLNSKQPNKVQPSLTNMDHTKRYRPLAVSSPTKRVPVIFSLKRDEFGAVSSLALPKQTAGRSQSPHTSAGANRPPSPVTSKPFQKQSSFTSPRAGQGGHLKNSKNRGETYAIGEMMVTTPIIEVREESKNIKSITEVTRPKLMQKS
jgi:hypothetical protein